MAGHICILRLNVLAVALNLSIFQLVFSHVFLSIFGYYIVVCSALFFVVVFFFIFSLFLLISILIVSTAIVFTAVSGTTLALDEPIYRFPPFLAMKVIKGRTTTSIISWCSKPKNDQQGIVLQWIFICLYVCSSVVVFYTICFCCV